VEKTSPETRSRDIKGGQTSSSAPAFRHVELQPESELSLPLKHHQKPNISEFAGGHFYQKLQLPEAFFNATIQVP
jgi:hypothetical protein